VTTAAPVARGAHSRTAGWASMAGATIEWYDFFLYGTASALIFNRIFFPQFDASIGTLLAFSTYAVGFFARPLGGVIFGHFGDRIGRKSTLIVTLMLMGVPTIIVGLVPSYESIGWWAALILVAMRFLQGLAVGGEWGGAALMAIEHAPEGRKGLFGSLPQAGVGFGLILSSLAMTAVARMPEADMLSWGWRLPFLASVLLLVVGGFIRARVPESPDFERAKAEGLAEKVPVARVLREHPRETLAIAGARIAENTWFYTAVTFALAYGVNQLGLTREHMLWATTAGAVLSLLTMPLFGHLGDVIGQRRMFSLGMLSMALFAGPFFLMLQSGHTGLVVLAMVLAVGAVFPAMYAPEPVLFGAQYPPEIRYSGISLSVQVAGAVGGGIAPIIESALVEWLGGRVIGVIGYLVALSLLALACIALMRPAESKPAGPTG